MANIKGGEKRAKQALVRRSANRSTKGEVHTLRNKLLETMAAGDKNKASTLCREFFSIVDGAVKRGILKANTGDRKKSRMAKRLAAMA